jgi:hypothetical protein
MRVKQLVMAQLSFERPRAKWTHSKARRVDHYGSSIAQVRQIGWAALEQ